MWINNQKGLGLIEVVISLLIVSTCLLAMLKLMHSSLDKQSLALNHTVATVLILDLTNRLKLNYSEDYSVANLVISNSKKDLSCQINQCTAKELKEYDMNQFKLLVNESLGQAILDIHKTINGYDVKFQWNDNQSIEVAITF